MPPLVYPGQPVLGQVALTAERIRQMHLELGFDPALTSKPSTEYDSQGYMRTFTEADGGSGWGFWSGVGS